MENSENPPVPEEEDGRIKRFRARKGGGERFWDTTPKLPGYTSTAGGSTQEGSRMSRPPATEEQLRARLAADKAKIAKQQQADEVKRKSMKEKKAKQVYRQAIDTGLSSDDAFRAASPHASWLTHDQLKNALAGGRKNRKKKNS